MLRLLHSAKVLHQYKHYSISLRETKQLAVIKGMMLAERCFQSSSIRLFNLYCAAQPFCARPVLAWVLPV
jgi:hypothetical protein